MHTPEGLRDLHERTHRKLAELIAHCGELDLEALNRVMEGFGDGTLRLRSSAGELRELLDDLLNPYRVGSDADFDAAVERKRGVVVAHLRRKRCNVAARHIGRIRDDEIERAGRAGGDQREQAPEHGDDEQTGDDAVRRVSHAGLIGARDAHLHPRRG